MKHLLYTFLFCFFTTFTHAQQKFIASKPDELVSTDNQRSKTNWQLVWSDEFQYSGAPDPKKWDYEIGYVRNKELQYFSKRTENIRVEDNEYLVIELLQDSAMIDGEIREITSASLTTRNKHSWTYGKIEIKAKIPVCLGTWPALWLLADSWPETPWPLCGEIDIMEHVGFDPDHVHNAVHTQTYNHINDNQKSHTSPLPDANEDFHIYGIEWSENKIDFFLDQQKVFTVNKEAEDTVNEWPFDQPFFLIINLAFGGSWGGLKGVNKQSLPQKLTIDYVRLYQAG